VEITGTMSAKTGACPAITFSVGSVAFMTNASTRFDNACTSFSNGDKVEVKGNRASSGPAIVTRLKKEN